MSLPITEQVYRLVALVKDAKQPLKPGVVQLILRTVKYRKLPVTTEFINILADYCIRFNCDLCVELDSYFNLLDSDRQYLYRASHVTRNQLLLAKSSAKKCSPTENVATLLTASSSEPIFASKVYSTMIRSKLETSSKSVTEESQLKLGQVHRQYFSKSSL